MTHQHAPKLPPRQQAFVQEYLLDLNATQAAIRAGYSAKTARQQSAQMLSNDKVADAITAAMADRAKRTGIDADRVLHELAAVAFSDLRGAFAADGEIRAVPAFDPDLSSALRSIRIRRRDATDDRPGETVTELRLWDKLNALERLGKHLGLFRDKVEVNVDGDIARLIAEGRRRVAERGS